MSLDSAARTDLHRSPGSRGMVAKVNMVGRRSFDKKAAADTAVRGTATTSYFPRQSSSRCPRGGQITHVKCGVGCCRNVPRGGQWTRHAGVRGAENHLASIVRGTIATSEFCCRQPVEVSAARTTESVLEVSAGQTGPLSLDSAARTGLHRSPGSRGMVAKVNVVGRRGVDKKAAADAAVRGTLTTRSFPGISP